MKLTAEHQEILETHWGIVRRIARGFSSTYQDDEFLGFAAEYLCRRVPRFDPSRGVPRAWIISHARYACLEYVDSLRRKKIPYAGGHDLKTYAENKRSQIEWLEAKEECGRLLGLLTQIELAVVNLYVFDGLTMEDTGKSLGVSQPGASKIMARALNKMRAAS